MYSHPTILIVSLWPDHETTQKNVQTRVAQASLDLGLMTAEHGVDVLHIAHHGSESSTSAAYYNLMKPEVGLISVGQNQGNFRHPREDVVDGVLLGTPQRADCVVAPPVQLLLQTDDGVEVAPRPGARAFVALAVGDIKVTTDGEQTNTITGTNRVHGGARQAGAPARDGVCDLDEQTDTPRCRETSF